MTKTKTSTKKSRKKPSRASAEKGNAKPAKIRLTDAKPVQLDGIQVLTPDGKKKTGRRGALGYVRLRDIKVIAGFNPRQNVGDTTDLENSIRKNGLLEPLVVRPSGDGDGKFNLVAGERRLRALKNLGAPFIDSVPVTVRTDLEGDELTSMAIAIAENSEDGRNNLTSLDIGRACERLFKKKWTIAAIAAHTGLHQKKVRRCLEVVKAPSEVIERVERGEMGMMAAIEVTKLPTPARKQILERAGPGATVDDIRKLRKKIETEDRRDALAKGEDKTKTKTGKARERKLIVRRTSRELTAQLRRLCHTFVNFEAAELETDSFYEMRGMIAALMWVQGELATPVVCSIDVKTEEDPKAAKKANAAFDILIKNEAELHKPEDDEGDEAEAAEAA